MAEGVVHLYGGCAKMGMQCRIDREQDLSNAVVEHLVRSSSFISP